MIPTVLVLALVGGILFPRRLVWVGLGVTLAWALILLAEGPMDSFAGVLGSLALAAANAMIVLVGVQVVREAAAGH